MKLPEKNRGRKLFDINPSNSFLDLSPEARETKFKNKGIKLRLKSFCIAKETINKMKRQPTEWEKMFANDMPDKRLIVNKYKQLVQLKIKETNKVIKNGAELNRHFSKEDMQMANQQAPEKMLNNTATSERCRSKLR